MVQEFHVLRCFSCQTFQVQQVKKIKKWTCKVCGEKQSLIKEFGRGAAADCRRHVQKLNALRGQLQEHNTEQLLTQCDEEDKYESEDVCEVLDQHRESEEVAHVSRWSKYTDQTAEGPNEHVDEEEDKNVYTERHQFKSQGTRKRKKFSNLKSFGGAYDSCEDQESWTDCFGVRKRPYLQHDKRMGSLWNKESPSKYSSCDRSDDGDLCTSTSLPSSRRSVCHFPAPCFTSTFTVENSGGNKQQSHSTHKLPAVNVTKRLLLNSESPSVSSNQRFGEFKIENKDSKWNKFLTVVPTQQNEEESDYQTCNSSNCIDNVMPCFTEVLTDTGLHSKDCRYLPNEKMDSSVLNRQKSDICVDKNVSSSTNSHDSKSGFENAVCKLAPLAKTPCSSLSLNFMFCTDEDFDDTF